MIKLKDLLNEGINIGSKEYFKKNMTDDEILALVNVYKVFPHSRLKTIPEKQFAFKDIANILGLPQQPTDIMTYTDGKGWLDKKKIKMNVKTAELFKMYKSGRFTMDEYGKLQKPLFSKYLALAKSFVAGFAFSKFS
jgi:hypothetical protein